MSRHAGGTEKVDFKSVLHILKDSADIRTIIGQWEMAEKNLDRSLNIARHLKDPTLEAEVHFSAGSIFSKMNYYARTLECAKQSLAQYRTLGDEAGIAANLNIIGMICYWLGDIESSERLLKEALEIREKTGDLEGLAETTSNFGLVHSRHGRNREMLVCFLGALELLRGSEDQIKKALLLNNIGQAYAALFDYEKAGDFCRQALEVQRNVGDLPGQVLSLYNAGYMLFVRGEYEGAMRYFKEALDLSRRIGDSVNEAWILTGMGRVQLELGNTDLARENLARAAVIARATGDTPILSRIEMTLGEIEIEEGNAEAVNGRLQILSEIASHYKSPITEAASRMLQARLIASKDPIKAEGLFRKALEVYLEGGKHIDFATASLHFASFLLERGRYDDASISLACARDIFIKIGNKRMVQYIDNLRASR